MMRCTCGAALTRKERNAIKEAMGWEAVTFNRQEQKRANECYGILKNFLARTLAAPQPSAPKSEAALMTPAAIRAARRELGMTQTQLADALQLAPDSGARTVRNWESGRVPITGPARVAIQLMLARHREARP